LESSYYFIKRDIAKKEYNIYQKTLSNVTNNCNYAHFPPYSEDRSSDSKDLAILLAHFNNIWYEDLTYGIYYSIMLHKTNDVINKTNNVIIENNLIFGLDVFLYNMWVANKSSLTSETLFKFFNDLFIFVNPKEYEGKEEKLVSYYKTHKDNINAILSSESGLIKCFSDIQGFVNMTANNPNIGFEQIDGCAILTSDLRQENVVYRVDDGNIGDIVFLKCQLDGQPHSYWGAMYNVTNEEVTIDNLIASFNKSMNESKNLKGLSLSISKNDGKEQKYVSKKTVRALLTLNNSASDEIKGQVFDMILQTYSHYLNHICWVVKNASSSHSIWDSIMIEMKTNNQFKVNVGYLNNVNQINTLVIESYDSLNTQFYMSIIKKYGINKSGGKYSSLFDSFKNECVNFNKLNSKKEWKNEVLNFFTTNDKTKGIDIKNCDDLIDEEINKAMEISYEQINGDFTIDVPSTQSFEGVGNKGQLLNKNQLQKITNSTAVVSVNEEEMDMLFLRYGYTEMNDSTDAWGETLAHYAYNNAIGDGGDCAKYVRMALEGALKTNTYNFSTNGRPESACRYWQFLNYWGFTCIYHGMSSQYNNTYQNGDIIVSAGLINGYRGIKDKHGHIQIYYKGKWYCDRMYPKANVYGTDRSCFIFRIANTFSNDFSTSISNANYKASESIINAIQHFEGFMPVWYPDSDSYSIGYGFKMTPDLSSKYPRTSANTCMSADRCGLIGKEKPNTKGCMTKQEANDYMRKTTLPTFENEFRQIMKDLPSYNQYQLDALFCLMYNIGPNGLKDKSPKLMQALKEQNLNNIVNEMNHGGSSHIKRRQWEQQLFREHKYPPYP
jgi:GH24 family phage-related lysozyme (muramidase)